MHAMKFRSGRYILGYTPNRPFLYLHVFRIVTLVLLDNDLWKEEAAISDKSTARQTTVTHDTLQLAVREPFIGSEFRSFAHCHAHRCLMCLELVEGKR